jgi:hypothetical protein
MPDDTEPDPKDSTTSPAPAPPAEPSPAPTGELGDAGKAALESERKARREAERAAREAQAELEKVRIASLSDHEKEVAAARREGERAGLRRIVEAELRAAAAGKMANPHLAARLLDVEELIPKDGDEVDGERVAEAIERLLEAEPYLRVSVPGATSPATEPAPAGRPAGTAPAGARTTGSSTAGTFSRSQLRDRTFFEANREAILKATAEGRITND